MRLLQVLHNYPPEFRGGIERYVEQVVAALSDRDHSVSVVAGSERILSAPALEEQTFEGVEVARLHRGPGWHVPVDPFVPGLVRLYEGVLERFRPDVVHVHHWWNLGDDLVRRAIARGVPAVVTLHDFFATCSLFFRMPDGRTPCEELQGPQACGPCLGTRFGIDESEIAFRVRLRAESFRAEVLAASAVLAPSEAHANALRKFLELDVDITVIPLGTPRETRAGRASPAFPEGPLRILHFGNLSRIKGVELLAAAVELADPSRTRIELSMAGELVDPALKLGRGRLLGTYDRDRLRLLASKADVAIFPSYARETYGMVVDEALELGLPVIVSNRGALAERIGERGLAVGVDDPEALAALLTRLLDDPQELLRLRSGSAPPLPDPAEHAARLESIYRRVRREPTPIVDLEGPLLARLERSAERIVEVMALIKNAKNAAPPGVAMVMEEPLVAAEPLPVAEPRAEPRPDRREPESEKLVSVIMRTRNRPDLLAEAVASVESQTWPHVELVVVNDGGDDVRKVLAPYQERLTITYLAPGPVGRCRAGNLGVDAARGAWIAWLDDDDLYYPDHLETLMTSLEQSGKRVAYSDAHRIDQVREHPGEAWREVGRSVPYSEDFSRIMLFRRAYIHLVTVVHHRECWARFGGFDEGLEVLEDWDLFFRFAQDYDFVHVPKVTAAFRIRSDGSNAVTALRRDFAETRSRLFARYIHVAFPELLGILDEGQHLLARLLARVEALEATVSRLEKSRRNEGAP